MVKKGEEEDINISDLAVDEENVRGGNWDYDEELITDIGNNGIENRLLVRPINDGDADYGIVQGSRRYNAAIEAGLDEVPCIVRKMDDQEARMRSIAENRHRKDSPKWQTIKKVGQTYEELNLSKPEFIEYIRQEAGISNSSTIERYISIYNLPEYIRYLIRPKDDRPDKLNDGIRDYGFGYSVGKELSLANAELISEELSDEDVETQLKVGICLMSETEDTARVLIEKVNQRPKSDPQKLLNEIKESKNTNIKLSLDEGTYEALEEACLDKQKDLQELVEDTISDFIIDEGYMQKILDTHGHIEKVEGASISVIKELGFTRVSEEDGFKYFYKFKEDTNKIEIYYNDVAWVCGSYHVGEDEIKEEASALRDEIKNS